MMAFFEGFISRFMPYLAVLAGKQGSTEYEYTDVHGVIDVTHTRELVRAFAVEIAMSNDGAHSSSLLDGVEVLQKLLETVINASN